jgi:AcrR family transcriptional regulator
MEHRTRQRRRHDATRERILRAAVALAHEEGWSSVTMRKIADRIDYSHPALYGYFATKEELLVALLRDGLRLLRDALEVSRDETRSPEANVCAVGAALWGFAWRHPELYQVMHGLGGVAFAAADVAADGKRAGEPAVAAIAALLAERGLDPADAERKTDMLWGAVHGLVSLTMAGRFSREEGAALAAEAVRDVLAGWGRRSAPDATDAARSALG